MKFSSKHPLVSIVIPVFNGESFIRETIKTALAQTYQNKEIIVIDDGSNDRTSNIIGEFTNEVTTLSISNVGVAGARNLGILLSRGEFVAFLDADDYWLPQKLQIQVKLIVDKDLDYLCGPAFQEVKGEIKGVTPQVDIKSAKMKFQTKFGFNPILPSSLVVRKLSLYKTGIFDTAFHGPSEDYDFHRRLVLHLNGEFGGEPLVVYRIHEKSAMRQPLANVYKDYVLALRKQAIDCDFSTKRFLLEKFKVYLMFGKEWIIRWQKLANR